MGNATRLRVVTGPRPEPLWRDVLGRRLRRTRHRRRLTLTQTAGRAGISAQYLSEIERGLKEPSSEVVAAVAGALGCTVLELAGQAVVDLRRSQLYSALPPSGPVTLAA